MSERIAARLAWLLWGAVMALVVAGHVLWLSSSRESPRYEYWAEVTVIEPTFATLGALIVARRPRVLIGWAFLVPAVAGGLQFILGEYATLATASGRGAALAGWGSSLMQLTSVSSVFLLLLLFPTRALPSRRWRPLASACAVTVALGLLTQAFRPGPLRRLARREPRRARGRGGSAWGA